METVLPALCRTFAALWYACADAMPDSHPDPTSNTDLAEWLEIHPGLALPRRFTHREPSDGGPVATVHMFVADDRHISCERVVVEPRSVDKPLTAQRLRAVQFGRLVQRAPVQAAQAFTFDHRHEDAYRSIRVRLLASNVHEVDAWLLEDAATSPRGRLADRWQDMSAEEIHESVLEGVKQQQPRPLTDDERAEVEAAASPPRRRRQLLTDDELREVARDYEGFVALGQRDPTVQVARARYASRSTASRWIRRARDLGYLAPASN